MSAQVPRPDQTLDTPQPPTGSDNIETLLWVQDRVERIQALLNSAVVAGDQIVLMQNMIDAYREFDAITLIGLYCRPAAIKAEQGRERCNLLDESYQTDLLSLNKRSVESIKIASQIFRDVVSCLDQMQPDSNVLFAPNEVIHEDAAIVLLDLSDGLASNDLKIFGQKAEHAIKVLEEIILLGSTLSDCDQVMAKASLARVYLVSSMETEDWMEINKEVEKAEQAIEFLKSSSCIRMTK
ncbi:MAG: hypothetical protein R2784_03095 [Saprospiraceae bacterium]